jgi:hypothetical protein
VCVLCVGAHRFVSCLQVGSGAVPILEFLEEYNTENLDEITGSIKEYGWFSPLQICTPLI